MADTIVKYIDVKGEKGKMTFKNRAITAALFEAAVVALSYCGFLSIVDYDDAALTTKTAPDGASNLLQNDKDAKCILTFFDTTNNNASLRIAIPAPKIDIAGGIATQLEQKRRVVPAVKATGAVGNDGTELARIFETMLGLQVNDLVFSSGSFTKSAS